jgi:hypothetical protein
VSPLFGNKDQPQSDITATLHEGIDRLNALTLPQLAAEVMNTGFGPTCPDADGLPTVTMIAGVLVPGAERSTDTDAFEHLKDLTAEGVQVLEHASLVRFAVYSSEGGKFFKLTRLGRSALDNKTVGRILSGGGQ